MIGAATAQPALDLTDSPVKFVDQLETRPNLTEPWLGEIEVGEQDRLDGVVSVGVGSP